MILERTVNLIAQIYRYHKIPPPRVSRIIVGSSYTGVEVEAFAYAPFLGLAYTLPSVLKDENQEVYSFIENLPKNAIKVMLKWAFNPLSLKKIIGLATLNAVSQHILKIINPYKKVKGDITDSLKINKETNITFIGLMKPIIRKVSQTTRNLTIIEDNIEISAEFKDLIVKSNVDQLKIDDLSTDILFCTGTTILNNTLEDILEKFRYRAGKIVVIGPTASMIPDLLFDNGVDIVGGMKIVDSSEVLKIIEEGGGTKAFKQYGKKYNLINE
jgi:uncharacterized protein (DUF4213/DUF364 family)